MDSITPPASTRRINFSSLLCKANRCMPLHAEYDDYVPQTGGERFLAFVPPIISPIQRCAPYLQFPIPSREFTSAGRTMASGRRFTTEPFRSAFVSIKRVPIG